MKPRTIKVKLCAALGLLILLLVVVGGSNLLSVRDISRQINVIDTDAYPLIISSMQLQLWIERSMATLSTAASASRQDLLEGLDDIEGSINKTFREIQLLAAESTPLQQEFKGIMGRYAKAREIGMAWVAATLAEDWEKEPLLAYQFAKAREELESAVERIKSDGVERFSGSLVSISDHARTVNRRTIGVCMVALICFFLSALFISRVITRPLERLLAVIQELRSPEAHLTQRVVVESQDEIGKIGVAFNGMLEDLAASRMALREHADSLESEVALRTLELNREKDLLRDSERYLKTLWNSTPSGVVIIDAETHEIVDANPYALELIGRTTKMLWGRSVIPSSVPPKWANVRLRTTSRR